MLLVAGGTAAPQPGAKWGAGKWVGAGGDGPRPPGDVGPHEAASPALPLWHRLLPHPPARRLWEDRGRAAGCLCRAGPSASPRRAAAARSAPAAPQNMPAAPTPRGPFCAGEAVEQREEGGIPPEIKRLRPLDTDVKTNTAPMAGPAAARGRRSDFLLCSWIIIFLQGARRRGRGRERAINHGLTEEKGAAGTAAGGGDRPTSPPRPGWGWRCPRCPPAAAPSLAWPHPARLWGSAALPSAIPRHAPPAMAAPVPCPSSRAPRHSHARRYRVSTDPSRQEEMEVLFMAGAVIHLPLLLRGLSASLYLFISFPACFASPSL